MRKRLFSILVCILLIVSLTACGASSAGSSPTPSAGASAPATSASASEPPFHITMMVLMAVEGEDLEKVEAKISEAAQRDINMTVDLVPVSFGNFA